MSELGLIDAFLELPHQKIETLTGQVGAERVTMADFRHLPTRCKFVALMPQWDFLNFLAAQAGRYKTFDLRMKTEATGLVEKKAASSACAPRRRRAPSRSAPIWWSVATDVIRPCARKPDW